MISLSLIFHWSIAKFLTRKNDWFLKEKIKMTYKKLVSSFVFFKISKIIINNFDIKPKILKLFFIEFWINSIVLVIMVLINIFNNFGLIYTLFYSESFVSLRWNNVLIFHFLFFIFTLRMISDAYKLSLRDSYRSHFLKLIWLDFFSLNFLSLLGTLIYKKTSQRKQFSKINNEWQINLHEINSQDIKEFFKTIFKIEIFTLLINFIIFVLVIIIGYFVQNLGLKFICLFCIFWTMVFIYGWIPQRIVSVIIVKKMFKNLLNNQNYFWLLTILRFLLFTFGYYYVAIFINLLKIDDNFREYILQNF